MAKNVFLKMSPIGVQPFQTKYFTGLLVVETRVRILFIAVEISLDYRILCAALEMLLSAPSSAVCQISGPATRNTRVLRCNTVPSSQDFLHQVLQDRSHLSCVPSMLEHLIIALKIPLINSPLGHL